MNALHETLGWVAVVLSLLAAFRIRKIFWYLPAFFVFLLLFDAPGRAMWIMGWYEEWSVLAPISCLWRLVVVWECLYRLFYRELAQEHERRENALFGGLLLVGVFMLRLADHQLEITTIPSWVGHMRVITALLCFGALATARIFTWAIPVRMMPGGFTHLWLLMIFFASNAIAYALPKGNFLLYDSLIIAVQSVCLTAWMLDGSHLIGIRPTLAAYRIRNARSF